MTEKCAHYWVARSFIVVARIARQPGEEPTNGVASAHADECSQCGERILSDDHIVREAFRLSREAMIANIKIERRSVELPPPAND